MKRFLNRRSLLLAVAIAIGLGVYFTRKPGPAFVPPLPDEQLLEPAVARAVASSRERVLAEPQSASAWGELGEVFLANELEDEAQTCFDRAAQLEPKNGRWPYLHAIVYINRGDRDASLPLLRSAAEASIAGDSLTPRLVLIEQLVLLGKLEEAEEVVQWALNRSANEPRVQFDAGLLAIAQRNDARAREHLERCLTSPYSRRAARIHLSALHHRIGNPKRAAEYQEESDAMAADAEWPDPVAKQYMSRAVRKRRALQVAEILESQGNFAAALGVLQPLSETFPNDDVIHMTLGRLSAQTGDLTTAESSARRARELAPDKVQPRYILSLILIEKGKVAEGAGDAKRAETVYADAEAEAASALKTKPDYGFAHMALGIARKQRKQLELARTALEEAARCNPEHGQIHHELAEVLAALGMKKEAIARWEQAVRLAPPNAPWRATAESQLVRLRSR